MEADGDGLADLDQPSLEHPVHGGRAEDRLGGSRQIGRVQQERVGLGATEPAVGADLLLEGGDLVGSRVVAGC